MQAAPKKAARKPSPVLSHLGAGPVSLWSAAESTAVWTIGRVPSVELVMLIFPLDCRRVVGFRPPRSAGPVSWCPTPPNSERVTAINELARHLLRRRCRGRRGLFPAN
jgi:hypothetical protein